MDHHCPFTVCCIGQHNHRYFYLFVTFGWFATIYATWLSLHPYAACMQLQGVSLEEKHACSTWTAGKPRLFLIASAACVLLSAFWLFVTLLRTWDMTIIEFLSFSSKKKESASSNTRMHVRTAADNMQLLLGPAAYWWRWLIPLHALHRGIPEHADDTPL